MTGGAAGTDILDQLKILSQVGVVGNLSDGQLLQRFVTARDGAARGAFSALVARHGPMVLRVCRQVLGETLDSDDAFQATFLVLARKAGSVHKVDSVAGWLYGVARRTAIRAKTDGARRKLYERRGAAKKAAITNCGRGIPESWPELHEEIARLPQRYREPIVLCYLEGLTTEAAALRLCCPHGTVLSRLSRARARLRAQLTRRDVVLPAGLLFAGLSTQMAKAAMPSGLLDSAVQAAIRFAASQSEASRVVPASVAALTHGELKAMAVSKITIVLAPVLALGVLASGGLGLVYSSAGEALTAAQVGAEPPPKSQVRIESPPEKPVDASLDAALSTRDPVDRALRQALSAALPTADPYRLTFALIGLAKARYVAGDHDASLGTFRLADQVARTVKNQHLRRLAVMRTAVARGRIGDKAPARAALEPFAREAEGLSGQARTDLMSMVIDFLDQAGFTDEAKARLKAELAIVEAADDEQFKDGGIYRLLHNQINLGDFEGALRAAVQYTDRRSNYRASLLGDIVRYRGARGAAPRKVVERARGLAQEVTYPYPRAMAECEIAAALAREGDIAGALALARGLDKGDGGVFAGGTRDESVGALAGIARARAETGDRPGAKATLREAFEVAQQSDSRDNGVLYERLRRVLDVQREIGDLEGAKTTADFIKGSNFDKTLALASLARGQANAGDKASAQATLREARALAGEVGAIPNLINDNPVANADRVFREVALAQGETGDLQGALATISARGSNTWKSEVLADLAGIRARKGDFAGARATAHAIPEADRAGEACYSIASLQARSGDTSAQERASELEAPDRKIFTLIGVAEGLALRRAQELKAEPRKP